MRASLEHEEVQVVAVNDPFIDLDYMVSNIYNYCLFACKPFASLFQFRGNSTN